MKTTILIIVLTAFLTSAYSKDKAPRLLLERPKSMHGKVQNLFEMVDKYDEITFYTLNPMREKKNDKNFHGYEILGSKVLKNPKHTVALMQYFYDSIGRNRGAVAGCFEPRHGFRIKQGDKTLDLVICFACASAQVHTGDKRSSVLIQGDGKVFNGIAKKLGMKVSESK